MPFEPFTIFASDRFRQAGSAYRTFNAQPSWVTRTTLFVVFLIIAVPIAMIIAAALFAGAIVFAILMVINMVITRLRGLLPVHNGRRNVRVIRHVDQRQI
jgi:hypothetical protein